ncbi:MAG: d(CMP) kinase, partial [Pseudobdellovibrionaceae bacterium]
AYRLKFYMADEAGLAELATSDKWQVRMTEERTEVYFGNENVTDNINAEEVGSLASKISHYPLVRKALLGAQRKCQDISQGLVAEGRDCGTVVFPGAPAKIYLTARSESRAERRAKEHNASAEAIREAQTQRDLQDTTRKAAPLQIPENALVVDTSELSLNEVVDLVEQHVRKAIPQATSPRS